MKCSNDHYKELLTLLNINEDAESDTLPAPVACQRFSSNSSNYDARSRFFSASEGRARNSDSAAANSSYFDCAFGPSANDMELTPLAVQFQDTDLKERNEISDDSGSASS